MYKISKFGTRFNLSCAAITGILLLFTAQVAFTMVDELCDLKPEQKQDQFFNVVDVDIPYNKESVLYRGKHYQGSAEQESTKWNCSCLWSVLDF